MERYWCLRWLGQEEKRQVEAVVLKDEVLRLVDIPLIIRLPGMPQTARGAQVRLDILRWDEVDLEVEARLLELLSTVTELDEEELDDENSTEVAEDFSAEEGAPVEVTDTVTNAEIAADDVAGNVANDAANTPDEE